MTINVIKLGLCVLLVSMVAFSSCSKDKKDNPAGDSDEAAAQRLAGTYKGTIHVVSGPDYYNAEITITKESGNNVKIVPKSGQAYSTVTVKTAPVEAVLGTQNVAAENASLTLIYQVNNKSINYLIKKQGASEIAYSFEGVRQ